MFNQLISEPLVLRQTHDAVPEVELVQSLRALGRSHPQAGALWEELFLRCEGLFQRHVRGLLHRPDLKEEALANMRENLFRTVMDTTEVFITQNFPRAVQCIARDEFMRLLRREGMLSQKTERPRNGIVPLHIPRSIQVSLEESPTDENGETHSLQLPSYDPCEGWLAWAEVQRILDYLHDPLDRTVVFLRAVASMKWDDIALCCHCTGRTARTRYSQACAFLRAALSEEQSAEQQGPTSVHRLKVMPPALKRVSVRERSATNGQKRTECKRQAVFDAVKALKEEKKPVTQDAVLAYAHVSPSFLRNQRDLAQMIPSPTADANLNTEHTTSQKRSVSASARFSE